MLKSLSHQLAEQLGTQVRRQAKRSAISVVGGYIAIALLLGALVCLALSFYLAVSESMSPATSAALTGLLLLVMAGLCMPITKAILQWRKERYEEQVAAETAAAENELPDMLAQLLQNPENSPINPAITFIQNNPTQAALLAAAAGALLGVSPTVRQKLVQVIQEFIQQNSAS